MLVLGCTSQPTPEAADTDAGSARSANEPNFADPRYWTLVGYASVTTTLAGLFPTVADVPVPIDGNDPIDPLAVVAKHRAVVIRDSDNAMFGKVGNSPVAPMNRAVGWNASATVTGTIGLELEPTHGGSSLVGVSDGGTVPCPDDPTVACTVFPNDGRDLRPTTTNYPWTTMVGLYQKGTGGASYCSGSFVGPRHILTAAHCVWDRSAHKLRKVDVVPSLDGMGNEPFGIKSVKYYVLPKGWDNEGSVRYDYALLVLWDEDPNMGWLGMAAKSHTSLNESSAWNVGYPNNYWTCADSPHAGGFCYDYLYAHSCNLEQVWASEIWHYCDAQKGQSGSPHYHYNGGNRQVVGVLAAESSYWNKDSRIRSGNFDSLCDWIGDYPTDAQDHDCY